MRRNGRRPAAGTGRLIRHDNGALIPYRRAAGVIERPDVDHAILRPARVNNRDDIGDGTTQGGEPSENPAGVVSRGSVAGRGVKPATTPGLEVRRGLGVQKA